MTVWPVCTPDITPLPIPMRQKRSSLSVKVQALEPVTNYPSQTLCKTSLDSGTCLAIFCQPLFAIAQKSRKLGFNPPPALRGTGPVVTVWAALLNSHIIDCTWCSAARSCRRGRDGLVAPTQTPAIAFSGPENGPETLQVSAPLRSAARQCRSAPGSRAGRCRHRRARGPAAAGGPGGSTCRPAAAARRNSPRGRSRPGAGRWSR